MIKYDPKSWFHLIFGLHKSDTIRILWKELIYMGLFTVLVAFIEIQYFPEYKQLKELIGVYSLVGFVISLLLVFRTNTAYDRWWEGRKKWGCIVNDSRNLGVKVSTLDLSPETADFFRRMISNFAFSMKEHLRDGVLMEELELTTEEAREIQKKEHIPTEIIAQMTIRLRKLKAEGIMSEEEYLSISVNVNALLDSLGACERIVNTPIPFSYSLFLKKFIFFYVTTLPLAFVTTFGYFSALIATFIFYVLVSMEVLAEEIEDPFGKDANDLPTDSLCKKIKANMDERFV